MSSKKKKKGGGSDALRDVPGAPPQTYAIGRQLDQEKIDQLTKRLQNLVQNNQGLRTSTERNEKDTHVILYHAVFIICVY